MSDKPGFTEGPWEVTGGNDVIIGSRYINAPCDEDANLIAASPDLYAALEEIIADLEGCYADGEPSVIKARAALAKARGEQ